PRQYRNSSSMRGVQVRDSSEYCRTDRVSTQRSSGTPAQSKSQGGAFHHLQLGRSAACSQEELRVRNSSVLHRLGTSCALLRLRAGSSFSRAATARHLPLDGRRLPTGKNHSWSRAI